MAQHVQHQVQHPAGSQPNPRPFPPPTHTGPSVVSTPGPGKSLSTSGPSAAVPAVPIFRAPAHKHAHHLHSIPPREKNTRTLIIDHMLWVHGRTRFAQARAELGMTDRTGGTSSTNYTHRRRPENYEEDDEEGSEGEQAGVLKARGDPDHTPVDDEEERMGRQDLPLARNLRLRAEGLEKVVTSMLDQPPPVHSIPEPDFITPPASPRRESGSNTPSPHPHILPNGVRLRLALGTMINDLFARQAPPPPYRHQLQSSASSAPGQSPRENIDSQSHLPPALAALSPISAISKKSIRFLHQDSSYMEHSSSTSDLGPQIQDTHHFQTASYSDALPDAPSDPSALPLVSIKPNDRVKELYLAGADPSTANSPPAMRCPRHLHTGCQICVEAKSPMKPTASANLRSRGKSASKAGESMGRNGAEITLTSGALDRSPAAVAGSSKAGGGAISGWQDGSGIGSGLLRPGVKGNLLRRKNPDWVDPKPPQARPRPGPGTSTARMNGTGSGSAGSGAGKSTGSGNAKLSSLIPRFIRLSALAAMELGNEIKDAEEEDKQRQQQRDAQRQMQPPPSPLRRHQQRQEMNPVVGAYLTPTMPSRSTGSTSAEFPARLTVNYINSGAAGVVDPSNATDTSSIKTFEDALRPTREWYLLLAGLLTRAVLEGYLTAGWQGYEAVQCLLTVGLGHADVEECKKREARSRGSSSARTTSTSAGTGDDFDMAIRDHGRRHDDTGVMEVGEVSGDEDDITEDDDEALEDDEGDHHGLCREDDDFSEFEPDEMPSLHEAIRILFPGFCSPTNARTKQTTGGGGSVGENSAVNEVEKTEAEQEYEREMKNRLWRFYDIPDSTPDLSTHMEDLAWQFPAEPVERAAVRFCEAVARWRGKPELESYKKRPPPDYEPRRAATNGSTNTATTTKPSGAAATTPTATTPATPAPNVYAFHPLRPPSHYQQDPSMYAQYQQMLPPPLPLTPSSTPMTIESLVHSSPISSGVSMAAAGNVYPYSYYRLEEEEYERRELAEKERKAREEIERRKRLKKPSIETYFMIPEGWTLSSASSTSSVGPIGSSGSLKRPRSPERILPFKRLHT